MPAILFGETLVHASMATSVDDVARLLELMDKHRVNVLEVGDVKLAKGFHDPLPAPDAKPRSADDVTDDDLFGSSE